MPEKLEDRLFRVTCKAYGKTKKVAEVIRAMTDEQLSELFSDVLEHALQSSEIPIERG